MNNYKVMFEAVLDDSKLKNQIEEISKKKDISLNLTPQIKTAMKEELNQFNKELAKNSKFNIVASVDKKPLEDLQSLMKDIQANKSKVNVEGMADGYDKIATQSGQLAQNLERISSLSLDLNTNSTIKDMVEINSQIENLKNLSQGADLEGNLVAPLESIKQLGLENEFKSMVYKYEKEIQYSEELKNSFLGVKSELERVGVDGTQSDAEVLNHSFKELRVQAESVRLSPEFISDMEQVVELRREQEKLDRFESTTKPDTDAYIKNQIKGYEELILSSEQLQEKAIGLFDTLNSMHYDDSNAIKRLKEDARDFKTELAELNKIQIDKDKFDAVDRVQIQDSIQKQVKGNEDLILSYGELVDKLSELDDKSKNISYDDTSGIRKLKEEIRDFGREISKLSRLEQRIKKDQSKFEYSGRVRILESIEKEIKGNEDLVASYEHLQKKKKALEDAVQVVSYDDLNGIRNLKEEIKDFGREVSNLSKIQAQQDRFEEVGRPELFDYIERQLRGHEELIASYDNLASAKEDLVQRTQSISHDDTLGIKQLKSDVRDFKAELRGLEKMSLDEVRFEFGRKANMERNLESIIVKYKDMINSSETLKNRTNELNEALKKLKFDDTAGITKVNNQIKDLEHSLKITSSEMKETGKSSGVMGSALQSGANQIENMILKVFALRTALRELKKAFEYVREIDSGLTEIQMVTGASKSTVRDWGKDYVQLSKDLKASNKDMTAGAVGFVRQGLEQQEVLERLQTTTKFAKITNSEFNETVDLLTATVNGMGVGIERASDVMIYMGDSTATSGKEVAKGLSKTAGSASALGVEFEKVASWIATISARTREAPESVGSAVNMIISRMARLTETGFDEEDGTQINDVAKALDAVGIALTEIDERGEEGFRGFGDVLDDLGETWDVLTNKEKSYVANAIAGARRQSSFIQLMDGYADSISLYEGAMESAGTTTEKYGIYLESLEAKIGELKISLEGLYETLVESGTAGRFLDFLIKGVDLLTKFVDQVGLLGTAFSGAGIKTGIGVISKTIGSAVAEGGGLSAALGVLNWKMLLIGGLLIAAPAVISKVSEMIKDSKFDIDNFNDSVETSKSSVSTLADIKVKYDDLLTQKVQGKDVDEELLQVQKDLAKLYPELAFGIDEKGEAYVRQMDVIDDLIEKEKELYEVELKNAEEKGQKRLDKIEREIGKYERRISREAERINKFQNMTGYDYLEVQLGEIPVLDVDKSKAKIRDYKKEIIKLKDEYQGIEDQVSSLRGREDELNDTYKESIARYVDTQRHANMTKERERELTNTLVDAGFKRHEAAIILKHGYEMVTEAGEFTEKINEDVISSIKDLNTEEVNSAKTLVTVEQEKLRARIDYTRERIGVIRDEITALKELHGADPAITSPVRKKPTMKEFVSKGVMEHAATVSSIKKTDEIDKLAKETKTMSDRLGKLDSLQASYDTRLANILKEQNDKKKREAVDVAREARANKNAENRRKRKEYRAKSDSYERINFLIEKNNRALEYNQTLQDRGQISTAARLKLLKEEIGLELKRESMLKGKAYTLRSERAFLQRELSKQGFRFAGKGDEMTITNMKNISGKSQKTEERFKRFIEIQTRELPGIKREWTEIKAIIENVNLERLDLYMENTRKYTKSVDKNLKQTQHQINMLADVSMFDNSEIAQINITEKRIGLLNQTLDQNRQKLLALKNELQEYRRLGIALGISGTQEFKDEVDRLEDSIMNMTETVKTSSEDIQRAVEENRKKWISFQNSLHDKQRDRLSELDRVQEEVVKIIRKRGELEKEEMDKRHNEEMELLKERQDEYKKNYDEDVDNFRKYVQDKMDALKDGWREEDYQEKLMEEQSKLHELNAELALLSMDDTLQARAKAVQLQKKITEQEDHIAKMQRDKERDDTEKMLQDKLKNYEDSKKDELEIIEDNHNRELELLEERQKAEAEHHEVMYSNSQVYAEAREALIRGSVETYGGVFESIESAFRRFSMEFEKGVGILGDVIQSDFLDQLEKAVEAINNVDYSAQNLLQKYSDDYDVYGNGHIRAGVGYVDTGRGSGSRTSSSRTNSYNNNYSGASRSLPKEFQYWNEADLLSYLDNKRAWNQGNASSKARRAEENANIREKYWGREHRYTDQYSYQELLKLYEKDKKRIAGYKTGGFVPRDGYVMAHEKEMFVPEQYQQKLWEFIKDPISVNSVNLPGNRKGIAGGDFIMEILVQGNLDKDVIPELEAIANNIIDSRMGSLENSMIGRGFKIRKV